MTFRLCGKVLLEPGQPSLAGAFLWAGVQKMMLRQSSHRT
jgi:hypothetical protein